MRDLTDRALDTANSLGAGYADVRIVRRLEESISVKSGRLEGVASGESEGFGVRVLVDGAWGFAASHTISTWPKPTASRPSRSGSRGPRRRPSGPVRARRPAAGPRPLRDAARGGPVRGAARAQDRRPDGRGPGRRRGPWRHLHRVVVRGAARGEDVRGVRRQLHRAGHHPPRRGRRGQRDRGRRAPAPQLPGPGRRVAGGRLRVHPRARPRRQRRAPRRGGRGPADRAAMPGRDHDRHPRPQPALQPGPRELRPSDRAGSRLRHGGVVRRDELPDHGQARRGLPLRLGSRDDRGRRHLALRDGHVRLGRRGRRRTVRAAHPGRDPGGLPDVAARRRRGSDGQSAAPCAPMAGTGSRSSG